MNCTESSCSPWHRPWEPGMAPGKRETPQLALGLWRGRGSRGDPGAGLGLWDPSEG